ncbi:ABC-2 type transport system permease protein [Micromonospora phaseoli]|uniref:ABC-2 type transport system permease protein n=1 Tax=Micromonospora phaseoli TaxID=1144548 RepID=A0A1H6YEA3_9ACTN|nr:anibiotic ABC transporter [Micromonospora phaseoli]PZW00160.1 ABC-2 type transport system permease protein [Micromonospora phaseoli]GIJ78866.1 exporter of polyketide antibiotics [Micromonospora phaseoli]SEJ39591.1 ABC-2 type transport system permease protein [Micromonospora phaseoli]
MSSFTGTVRLARLALRRDRIRLAIWVGGTSLIGYALAESVAGLYPDEQTRLGYAETAVTSVVARAFNGPIAGTDLGAVVVTETYLTLALLAALLSTFAVVRHTRQNEETGRAELLGAAAIGRYALLTAALVVVVGANVLAAALLAVAFAGAGLPIAGSVAAAAAIGGVGVAFTGVAAVTAQLSVTSRGANALAAAAVGVAFLLRAAGDVLGEREIDGVRLESAWPTWLSPLGWGTQVGAFAAERWWVLALPVALLVVGVAVAYSLAERRDVGAGLLAARRGPARAASGLLSPTGLSWRLQRGALAGWAVAVAVLGLSMGVAGHEVDAMIAENPAAAEAIAQLGGGSELVDAYLAAMLGLFALTIGAYVVQALLRIRADESDGILEPLLATAVSRTRWLGTQVLGAVFGASALMLLAGVTTGLGYGLATGDPVAWTVELGWAGLLRLPALLVVAGVVTALFGAVPRWSVALSWTALIAFLLLGQLGAVLDLPQAALNLSPYSHVPSVPAVDVTVLPLVALTAVAAALLATGLLTFRRRDTPT